MSKDEVLLSCVECGRSLRFRIENEVVVEGEGRIAINVPCGVCLDCVDLLLSRVADPPGLIIFDGLSAIVARETLKSFSFLRPKSEASRFFEVLLVSVTRSPLRTTSGGTDHVMVADDLRVLAVIDVVV